MSRNFAKNEDACPREEIALYLDGELSSSEEMGLERHFAKCAACLAELNLQKKVLSALDCAFDGKAEIELPKNFAKIVATAANSNVSGLRSKKERPLAVFLCAGMFLLILLGFGTESSEVFGAVANFTEQITAVTGFIFHSIYGFLFGISIILRYSSQQIVFGSVLSLLLITGLFFVSFALLSRFMFRYNR